MTTPISIDTWRRARREALLAARIAAGGARRRAWSEALEPRIVAALPPAPDLVLAIYWPYKGEYDARPLASRLLEAGATLALPAVLGRLTPLEFRRWRPGDPTEPGAFRIPVPAARDLVTPNALLVPLVGFDAANYRLGFGGGFYDVTLAAMAPVPLTVGIGFEIGRLDTIHPQPHDIPLDVVVTESAVQRI